MAPLGRRFDTSYPRPVPAPTAAEPLRFGTAAGRWALFGTVLGSSMTMLDATVVNIALPRLGRDLHADFAGLQWVVNGYTLALASLILLGGSLGDRLGRRRLFTVGAVWFTSASLLCAIAPTVEVLVAARALQGIGGAMLAPGSLAILQSSFHTKDRAQAIGAWAGLGGVTTAVGPFLGGWLVTAASWRWIFLLNLPLGVMVVLVALTRLPETKDPGATGRLDFAGAVLGAGGLAASTWGLIQQDGRAGAAGVALLGAFVAVERRSAHPMMPLGIFRSRQFSATNAVTLSVYGALAGSLFMVGLVLQEALGYEPLEAGIATLPITLTMLTFSARAGALARRIGPGIPMTVGPAVMSVGLLLLTRVQPGAIYLTSVLPALVVLAGGLATTVAPLTATALASVDEHQAGVASGINNAVARTGGLLAVAVIPIVAGFRAGSQVAPATLVTGFHRVVIAAAVAMAVAAVTAWALIRSDVLANDTDSAAPSDDPAPRPQMLDDVAADTNRNPMRG